MYAYCDEIVTTKDELKQIQSDLNDILCGNLELYIAKNFVLFFFLLYFDLFLFLLIFCFCLHFLRNKWSFKYDVCFCLFNEKKKNIAIASYNNVSQTQVTQNRERIKREDSIYNKVKSKMEKQKVLLTVLFSLYFCFKKICWHKVVCKKHKKKHTKKHTNTHTHTQKKDEASRLKEKEKLENRAKKENRSRPENLRQPSPAPYEVLHGLSMCAFFLF